MQARPKLTQKKAGELIGVSEQAISQWERGITEPTRENLIAAALAYGTTLQYLASGDYYGVSSEDVAAELSRPAHHPDGMPFGGIAEAGTFRSVDMLDQDSASRRIPIERDPRFPKARHYAFEVRGDSMDLEMILDGMWAVGLDYKDYVEHYGDLRDGFIVVAERTRAQGSERELTIKQVRFFRDRMELWPRSSNSNHVPLIVPHNKHDESSAVTVVAVVTRAVRLLMI